MGNQKFRFSDMIPIVCFNNKANKKKKKKKKKPFDSLLHSSSFYYSPRNSFGIRREKRKTVYKPSPKAFTTNWSHSKSKITSFHNQDSSDHSVLALESSSDSFVIKFYDSIPPVSSRCSNFIISSSAEDIVIDMKDDAFTKIQLEEIKGLKDSVSNKMEKPANGLRKNHLSVKVTKDDYRKIQKKHKKPGIKLVNSRRIQVSRRKSESKSKSKGVFNSFAMIKRSVDPKRDFKESMLEMIVENNITSSKDLQDLLACYLSLNPTEYHNVIIKVFEQIWFQLSKIRSQ